MGAGWKGEQLKSSGETEENGDTNVSDLTATTTRVLELIGHTAAAAAFLIVD